MRFIKIEHDPKYGLLYFYLRPIAPGDVKTTVQIDKDTNFDYDAIGTLIGIELLDVASVTVERI